MEFKLYIPEEDLKNPMLVVSGTEICTLETKKYILSVNAVGQKEIIKETYGEKTKKYRYLPEELEKYIRNNSQYPGPHTTINGSTYTIEKNNWFEAELYNKETLMTEPETIVIDKDIDTIEKLKKETERILNQLTKTEQ